MGHGHQVRPVNKGSNDGTFKQTAQTQAPAACACLLPAPRPMKSGQGQAPFAHTLRPRRGGPRAGWNIVVHVHGGRAAPRSRTSMRRHVLGICAQRPQSAHYWSFLRRLQTWIRHGSCKRVANVAQYLYSLHGAFCWMGRRVQAPRNVNLQLPIACLMHLSTFWRTQNKKKNIS